MSTSDVTRQGVRGARPARDALTGSARARPDAPRRDGRAPEGGFRSYYGRPVLNRIPWAARDIAGYLFLGGLAGSSSVLAAGAELSGRPALARTMKATALGAITGSVAALVNDLGRPARFVNMLRVCKPTSPMSVGSWLLAGYGPLAGAAAATELTGRFRRPGTAATVGAALLGPAVAAYTAPLICDTAVPAWHEGYREMPFVFTGSGAAAAAGVGLLGSPPAENGPARRAAVFGAALETAALARMRRRTAAVADTHRGGRAGVLLRAAEALTATGALGAAVLGRHRWAARVSGAALVAGSACTRFGIFYAGIASAEDPRYTVVPQRERVRERAAAGLA
ncbi:NrfD/PsrC family molybdoenzyme membrane anchor subunit [Marinitenerispora sediminis]|uniref:Polysulfide reductase n=1 Tax=Marinitenerispora sediminis TaxID=1931232 RepID=A0A368T0I5_9ACTN|nr:NrfD/PsrC family molybdoenzyme membrane anchor subunit [Marinitenerispora sediminis]RCV50841.1 polysulfide reductase [Marinitenerispora sediminis]RCV51291.1 polysulfide reductase [Marinitenerispora sediminis]RCV52889.1 polysulfide reductase [Marinitenerispora sediminis]